MLLKHVPARCFGVVFHMQTLCQGADPDDSINLTFSEEVEASPDGSKAVLSVLQACFCGFRECYARPLVQVVTIQNLYTGASTSMACKSNSVAEASRPECVKLCCLISFAPDKGS